MEDIKALAIEASRIIDSIPWSIRSIHGIEVEPGWFNIRNEETGQCRNVVYHPESGYIFKQDFIGVDDSLSNRVIGSVTWDDKTYRVRLPEFYTFPLGDEYDAILAQEYVVGNHCECNGGAFCSHAKEISTTTKCRDAHIGNWKITDDGDIVLFDFEGIQL